jgi:hypothetical protein
MKKVGIHPSAVNPGEPLFFEGVREQMCVGGPSLGP